MTATTPTISVVIPTRNRGERVRRAVESVLRNESIDFELLLVDQSTDARTETAVQPYVADGRFRYIRSKDVGTGRARQLGLDHARAALVAMTDDDCTVPADWLATISVVFDAHPQVGLLFCNVDADVHDPTAGLVPTYHRDADRVIRSLAQNVGKFGIGAGMAMRRDAVLAIGGFDTQMGPGSLFRSGEELDLMLRMLIQGHWVYDLAQVAVVHDGFRTWAEYQALAQRDWYATGAAFAKPLRRGHWVALRLLAYVILVPGLWEPLRKIFSGQLPRGLRRPLILCRGLVAGWRMEMDARQLLYKSDETGPQGPGKVIIGDTR